MKKYKKLWFRSFGVTIIILIISIIIFMNYMKNNPAKTVIETKTDSRVQTDIKTDYYEPQDNVGAISFTEDQITELARKLFSADGYLSDLTVGLDTQTITISARIKDKNKLIEIYPELKKFDSVLTVIEGKRIAISGGIVNHDGRAAVEVDRVMVGESRIDGEIISPFIEADEFSSLFDVEYENIEIKKGEVVFKNGVPDILKID